MNKFLKEIQKQNNNNNKVEENKENCSRPK